MRLTICFCLLVMLTGCAHYEYNIVAPASLYSHIGTKADDIVHREPLEYRFRAVDSYLVARIYNHGNDPIQLVGDQSVVVAPNGQSHPLRSQTIAPDSFIKLIFPPIPPQVVPNGPVIGIGFGARVGHAWPRPHPQNDDKLERPRYLLVDVPDGALYWDWTGQSQVTVLFVFREGDRTFQQRFVFGREKR